MPAHRRVSRSALKLAAFFTVLFLALTGALILTVLWIVEGSQRGALQAANDADIAMIANGYRSEGVSEAIEVVQQRLTAPPASGVRPSDSYLLIEDGQGRKLAGNMTAIMPRVGVFDLRVAPGSFHLVGPAGADDEASFAVRGRGVRLGPDLYAFAGRDWRIVSETRTRILDAFVWVAVGATLIAAVAGWFLGSKFMRRVNDVARTCENIIGGHLSDRIALRGSGDEWDRLAGAINDMLNRIERLLENLQQVSSDVAHDLRSPLTRLRNRLEVAHSDSTTVQEYAAAVARALDDTDQLLAMFAALLRISQVEAGTRAGAFAEVSLSDVLRRLFEMYRPVAEDYRQELQSDIREDVRIRGDSELITQMFSNLIENAIRHTPMHSIIRLSVESSGNRPVVVVRDNGDGIPPDEHGKVIRRFYRLSSSRTTSGHGLGLALVAAIAELHHANLSFGDARPGLEVRVAFPPVRAGAGTAQRSADACAASEGRSSKMCTDPGRMP